jgi:hypothetical protein
MSWLIGTSGIEFLAAVARVMQGGGSRSRMARVRVCVTKKEG